VRTLKLHRPGHRHTCRVGCGRAVGVRCWCAAATLSLNEAVTYAVAVCVSMRCHGGGGRERAAI